MLAADVVRAVLGAALLGWLPGYVWTRVLLPGLDRLERFLFAVVLSVALVSLSLFAGNVLLGLRVSPVHAVWYALFYAFLGAAIPVARRIDRELARRAS